MREMRVYGNVEEAQAARQRLEQSDSKATAEVIGPDDGDAQARLEQAKLSEQDIISGLDHLRNGRALLLLDVSMLDMMRLNDLLGPNEPSESKAWTPGVGHLEDEVGKRRNTPERSEL